MLFPSLCSIRKKGGRDALSMWNLTYSGKGQIEILNDATNMHAEMDPDGKYGYKTELGRRFAYVLNKVNCVNSLA